MMEKCTKRNHRFRVVGFSWTQYTEGKWNRFMIEECLDCHFRDNYPMIWVNTDLPVCSHCLSQELDVVATDQGNTSKCTNCGLSGENIIYLEPKVSEYFENPLEVEDEDDYEEDDDEGSSLF